MKKRQYYSTRTKKNNSSSIIDLDTFIKLFRSLFSHLEKECFFQESFGYCCVDRGEVSGTLGADIEAEIHRRLRKENIWPIERHYTNYSEEDLFDLIEFLYDCVSKPIDGYFHGYGNCGWHYETFDKASGQKLYREEVNDLLADYKNGYILDNNGEILITPIIGFDEIINNDVPKYDPDNVDNRVNRAISKFRNYHSSLDNKREAIRDLSEVLEFLRPKIKILLSKKDDALLFDLANNFGIRHHNQNQNNDYDKDIWYEWIFYFYLATIHAVLGFINNNDTKVL